MHVEINFLVFTFAQQNRDEHMWSNSALDGVKWKDLMSTLILDRLEASFDNNWEDALSQTTVQVTQNTKTDCDDGRPQCTIVGRQSSRMEYFDSVCNYDDDDDHTGYLHTTTDRDSIV